MVMTPSKDAEAERAVDAYLVVAARAGDRRAFDQLARRWHQRMTAHAWRLTGDGEAARDAVQSAWLDMARGLSRLRDEHAFPAWAYRIVTRRCARFIAGRQDDRRLAQDMTREAAAAEQSPSAPDAAREDETRRLHAAIRSLPAAQRAALPFFTSRR